MVDIKQACDLNLTPILSMRHTLRFLRYLLEAAAAIVGIAIIVGIIIVWRLNAAPVKTDIMTPYIKAGIESAIPGSTASVGQTLIEWDKAAREVSMSATDIQVLDAKDTKIVTIPSFRAKISLLGLIFGQFMPSELYIRHPQIKLVRLASGSLAFGGTPVGNDPSTTETPPSKPLNEAINNISETMSRAALLQKMAVTQAVFDIYDETDRKDWPVAITEISITRRGFALLDRKEKYGTLDGRIAIELSDDKNESSLNIIYSYDPSKREHSLSSSFKDVVPASLAGSHPEALGLGAASIADLPLSGTIKISLDKNLSISSAVAQIRGDQGRLIHQSFWDKPCPVKSMNINASYDRSTKTLLVDNSNIDFGGPVLTLKIDGTASSHPGQDLDFSALITADNMPMNRYAEIWPKPVLPNPRYWLETNLRNGIFARAEVKLNGYLSMKDPENAFISDGGGKITATGGSITYLDGMPPVEKVSATATFDLKTMSVKISEGSLGNIVLSPFTIQITGLADVDQYIDIPLQVSGPIPEILRLLDHKPLEYAKALGIKPEDISGKMTGEVNFKFPLLKTLEMKDVYIHADAAATSVVSDKLVPGIPINQGDLKLSLDTSGLDITGKTLLGKSPFNVVWRENFNYVEGKPVRRAKITGEVKDNQWEYIGVHYLEGTQGIVKVALDMTKPKKNETVIAGTVDMAPAAVAVKILNWKKPAGIPATLKFVATSKDDQPVEVSDISLRGSNISANGSAVFSPDMSELLSLNMPKLQVGRTNASVRISKPPIAKNIASFEAKGAALDISGMKGEEDEEDSKPEPYPVEYRIQVDKLYTGENGTINNAKGFASRDKEGWKTIDLRGLADGDAPLNLELTPQNDGTSVLAITCESFGKAMKGLGFTDTITGGRLSVIGRSTTETPRIIDGTIKISDFTVENLPVLARLMNATSPFGFPGLLTDSADFSRLKGHFHLQGNTITLTKAHAAGSAIGINADGKINIDSGEADLQGTLVPFSVMNKIINYIPLIGDLITGGQDQGVLAVSYKIEGSLSSPQISVNPVSLLTPGFLRNLFFREENQE